MPTIEVNGKAAYYHQGGAEWQASRPWVALIHGAGCTHAMWQQQSRALAHHGFNVLVPDLPGHGASADQPFLTAVEAQADWLQSLLAAVGAPAAAVVGHSLGACIAAAFSAQYPSQVTRLVLVGSALEMRVNPTLLQDCLANPARAVAFITSYGHGGSSHLGAAPTPGMWLMGSDQALLAASSATVLHRDFEMCARFQGAQVAARVRAPTLVVSGAADRMTPSKAGAQLAVAIAGARHVVLPDVGHMLPTEAPRALLKLIRDFCGQPPSGSPVA